MRAFIAFAFSGQDGRDFASQHTAQGPSADDVWPGGTDSADAVKIFPRHLLEAARRDVIPFLVDRGREAVHGTGLAGRGEGAEVEVGQPEAGDGVDEEDGRQGGRLVALDVEDGVHCAFGSSWWMGGWFEGIRRGSGRG